MLEDDSFYYKVISKVLLEGRREWDDFDFRKKWYLR